MSSKDKQEFQVDQGLLGERTVSGNSDPKSGLQPGSKFSECISILRSVSVEPAAMCMMTSTLMTYLLFQNLFIQNICRVGLNNSAEVCQSIVAVAGNYSQKEREIQEIVAQHKIYRSVLDHTFPILFVIFVGPWSDYYGRKVPLLLSTLGTMLYALFTMICAYHVDTIDPLWMNLISAVPRTLTGGEVAFGMAAYSYISDQSDHRYRTVRTGMLNAGYQLGIPLGFALASLATRKGLSYPTGFAISAAISLLGLVFVVMRVKNEGAAEREAKKYDTQDKPTDKMEESGGKSPSCWSIVNPRNNFVQVVSLPFKKRANHGRVKIWCLLAAFIFSAAPIHGEFQLMYLFVRERLGWDVADFGDFASYNWFIGVTGVVLSMGIFSKWLQMPDPILGFISGLSQMGGCVLYLMAHSGIVMYLASTVDLMNGTMIVIARSMLSKLVGRDEIGKLFSLIAVLESFIPLGMNPVYATLYGMTVHTFSGSFIILSALLTIPPQLVYVWFIFQKKGRRKSSENDVDAAPFPMELDNVSENKS